MDYAPRINFLTACFDTSLDANILKDMLSNTASWGNFTLDDVKTISSQQGKYITPSKLMLLLGVELFLGSRGIGKDFFQELNIKQSLLNNIPTLLEKIEFINSFIGRDHIQDYFGIDRKFILEYIAYNIIPSIKNSSMNFKISNLINSIMTQKSFARGLEETKVAECKIDSRNTNIYDDIVSLYKASNNKDIKIFMDSIVSTYTINESHHNILEKKLLSQFSDSDFAKKCLTQTEDVIEAWLKQKMAKHEAFPSTTEGVFAILCKRGKSEMVELLLRYKSYIEATDKLFFFNVAQNSAVKGHPFSVVCADGNEDMVRILLKRHEWLGDDFFLSSDAFEQACTRGHTNIVNMLIQNRNILGDKFFSNFIVESDAFSTVCRSGNEAMVEILLNNRGLLGRDSSRASDVFKQACMGGHTNIVNMLIQNRNILGDKFFSNVEGQLSQEVVEILRDKGLLRIINDAFSNSLKPVGYTGVVFFYSACNNDFLDANILKKLLENKWMLPENFFQVVEHKYGKEEYRDIDLTNTTPSKLKVLLEYKDCFSRDFLRKFNIDRCLSPKVTLDQKIEFISSFIGRDDIQGCFGIDHAYILQYITSFIIPNVDQNSTQEVSDAATSMIVMLGNQLNADEILPEPIRNKLHQLKKIDRNIKNMSSNNISKNQEVPQPQFSDGDFAKKCLTETEDVIATWFERKVAKREAFPSVTEGVFTILCMRGKSEMVELLLRHKDYIEQTDKLFFKGSTNYSIKSHPLSAACMHGAGDVVHILLKCHELLGNDFFISSDAFEQACTRGHMNIVEMLIKNRNILGDAFFSNIKGPLAPEVVKILLKYEQSLGTEFLTKIPFSDWLKPNCYNYYCNNKMVPDTTDGRNELMNILQNHNVLMAAICSDKTLMEAEFYGYKVYKTMYNFVNPEIKKYIVKTIQHESHKTAFSDPYYNALWDFLNANLNAKVIVNNDQLEESIKKYYSYNCQQLHQENTADSAALVEMLESYVQSHGLTGLV